MVISVACKINCRYTVNSILVRSSEVVKINLFIATARKQTPNQFYTHTLGIDASICTFTGSGAKPPPLLQRWVSKAVSTEQQQASIHSNSQRSTTSEDQYFVRQGRDNQFCINFVRILDQFSFNQLCINFESIFTF